MDTTIEKMSKEEMIDTLKGLVFGTFDKTTAKEREALNMAITLLENREIKPTNNGCGFDEMSDYSLYLNG